MHRRCRHSSCAGLTGVSLSLPGLFSLRYLYFNDLRETSLFVFEMHPLLGCALILMLRDKRFFSNVNGNIGVSFHGKCDS
jgi:hypothetical protein